MKPNLTKVRKHRRNISDTRAIGKIIRKGGTSTIHADLTLDASEAEEAWDEGDVKETIRLLGSLEDRLVDLESDWDEANPEGTYDENPYTGIKDNAAYLGGILINKEFPLAKPKSEAFHLKLVRTIIDPIDELQ